MAASEHIKCEVEGGLAVLTLNRPRALNALTLDMMRSMTETLRRWEADEAVRLIVVVGEGERAFCAGGDVKSIAAARGQHSAQREFIKVEYRLDLLISRGGYGQARLSLVLLTSSIENENISSL